jgi:hypothetical protein
VTSQNVNKTVTAQILNKRVTSQASSWSWELHAVSSRSWDLHVVSSRTWDLQTVTSRSWDLHSVSLSMMCLVREFWPRRSTFRKPTWKLKWEARIFSVGILTKYNTEAFRNCSTAITYSKKLLLFDGKNCAYLQWWLHHQIINIIISKPGRRKTKISEKSQNVSGFVEGRLVKNILRKI